MYHPVKIAPLSKASIHKLLRGGAVRIQHGNAHTLHLSKEQLKKHHRAVAKGKGHNVTLDPYQMQMHGKGFFDDIGEAFNKHIINPAREQFENTIINPIRNDVIAPAEHFMTSLPSTLESEGKKVGRKLKSGGERLGRATASALIHKGIPAFASTLGGVAGSSLGALSGPVGSTLGGLAGSELGSLAGQKLGDYVGSQTGYGLMDIVRAVAPHAKKAVLHVGKELGKAIVSKGLKMAEELAHRRGLHPSMIHEAKNLAHAYAQDPSAFRGNEEHLVKEVVEGALSGHPMYHSVKSKMHQMFGHGMRHHMRGGTALIDQPFSFRQATDSASNFVRDPMGSFGFGLKKHKKKPVKHGGALSPAGMGLRKKKHPRRHMHGGMALIDQPFTVRQATDSASSFARDPLGAFGYGLKKHKKKPLKRSGALHPAGYGLYEC